MEPAFRGAQAGPIGKVTQRTLDEIPEKTLILLRVDLGCAAAAG